MSCDNGVIAPWQDANFEGLLQTIRDWATWAMSHPAKPAKEDL